MKVSFISRNNIHLNYKKDQLSIYKGLTLPYLSVIGQTCHLVNNYVTDEDPDVIMTPFGTDLLLIERSDRRVCLVRFLNETGEFLASRLKTGRPLLFKEQDELEVFIHDHDCNKHSFSCVGYPVVIDSRYQGYIITTKHLTGETC